MTLAERKKCPKCGSRLFQQWDSFSIWQKEIACLCGYRPTIPAPALTRWERESYHMPVSEKKKSQIDKQLVSMRKIIE